MKITAIKVKAGLSFHHPNHGNSHFKPEIEIIASIRPNDDIDHVVGQLQKQAHQYIETYKQNVLRVCGSVGEVRP